MNELYWNTRRKQYVLLAALLLAGALTYIVAGNNRYEMDGGLESTNPIEVGDRAGMSDADGVVNDVDRKERGEEMSPAVGIRFIAVDSDKKRNRGGTARHKKHHSSNTNDDDDDNDETVSDGTDVIVNVEESPGTDPGTSDGGKSEQETVTDAGENESGESNGGDNAGTDESENEGEEENTEDNDGDEGMDVTSEEDNDHERHGKKGNKGHTSRHYRDDWNTSDDRNSRSFGDDDGEYDNDRNESSVEDEDKHDSDDDEEKEERDADHTRGDDDGNECGQDNQT